MISQREKTVADEFFLKPTNIISLDALSRRQIRNRMPILSLNKSR